MQHAKDYGLKADNVGYDAKAVVQHRSLSQAPQRWCRLPDEENKVSII
jgi:hypothetical protein